MVNSPQQSAEQNQNESKKDKSSNLEGSKKNNFDISKNSNDNVSDKGKFAAGETNVQNIKSEKSSSIEAQESETDCTTGCSISDNNAEMNKPAKN